MTLPQILSVFAAYAVTSVVVGLVVGRILRNANVDYLEVCIEPECTSAATHERLIGITTEHVPAGDADGFSSVVELACARHGEVRRS